MIDSFLAELPIKFHNFPHADEPRQDKKKSNKYFVNRAISGLTKKVFIHSGWSETESMKDSKLIWGRQLDDYDFKHIPLNIKINHFFHPFLLGRKDEFHQRMRDYEQTSGERMKYYPLSFIIPQEIDELMKVYSTIPYWISKPAAASSGKGIKIFSSKEKLPVSRGIIQQYLDPYLINGKKFDLRLYFLVTSCDPMKIYIYQNGLVRFATEDYDVSTIDTNVCAHLTNYSVNKDAIAYVQKREENAANSKWSLSFFLKQMESVTDTDALMKKIEKACTSIILCGQTKIRDEHKESKRSFSGSFELYGVDVMLDKELNPYVIEVNISPSMEGGQSKMDSSLKIDLLTDTFNTALIIEEGFEIRSKIEERTEEMSFSEPFCDPEITALQDMYVVYNFIQEQKRKGNYKLVFPTTQYEEYSLCFTTPTYRDLVLRKWVSMSPDEQEAALKRFIPCFRAEIEKIMNI